MATQIKVEKPVVCLTPNAEYLEGIKSAPVFGIKDKLGYMFGDLGFNSLQVLVNTYLMIFFVNVLQITPLHFSVIIALCKASDAINDPFIGRAVDNRAGTKFGKYKPFLTRFLLPYMVTTIMLFVNLSAAPYALRIGYALLTYFIWGIIGTFINVPYGAMLNSITSDMKGRTDLSNFRSIGSMVANVLVTSVAPLILFDEMDNPVANRFIVLSVILSIFTGVCLLLTHLLTKERVFIPDKSEEQKHVNYFKIMKTFMKNRPMIAVISAYIISKFFIQTTGIMNQYVFMSHYKATEQLAALGLGTLVPLFAGMLLVKPLINRFGKKSLITWPALLAAASFAVNAFFPVSSTMYIVFQLLGQFFIGFFSLLIWSLIADAVDFQAYLTKERNDGTIYATITFLVFLVSSLSTSMIALLLDVVGYDVTLGAAQATEVAASIKFVGGILPVIGAVLIFVCFHFIYNISDEQMQKISSEVNAQP